jgi:hypothetical protein
VKANWSLQGELALSCSCDVFCPCVLSLGNQPPTEGFCQTWAGIRIDRGHFDAVDLSGINVALMGEIPGRMSRGNRTLALFVDADASTAAADALTEIFRGHVGGSTQLLSILVGNFLGTERVPVNYRTEGESRIVTIDKIIDGKLTPVTGKDKKSNVIIRNSEYWVAPDVTVAQAETSRFRAFGRNWNFAGQSAEICQLDWGSR